MVDIPIKVHIAKLHVDKVIRRVGESTVVEDRDKMIVAVLTELLDRSKFILNLLWTQIRKRFHQLSGEKLEVISDGCLGRTSFVALFRIYKSGCDLECLYHMHLPEAATINQLDVFCGWITGNGPCKLITMNILKSACQLGDGARSCCCLNVHWGHVRLSSLH